MCKWVRKLTHGLDGTLQTIYEISADAFDILSVGFLGEKYNETDQT